MSKTTSIVHREVLKKRKIIHRDISPYNLFIIDDDDADDSLEADQPEGANPFTGDNSPNVVPPHFMNVDQPQVATSSTGDSSPNVVPPQVTKLPTIIKIGKIVIRIRDVEVGDWDYGVEEDNQGSHFLMHKTVSFIYVVLYVRLI
jgi:serine/threonine protein kinase